MKNWLLCFFAILIVSVCAPFAAKYFSVADSAPIIRLSQKDEIIEISAEDYALCVLLAEGKDLSKEAKKALAVAARSTAVYISMNGYKHNGFDVCDDPNCCLVTDFGEIAEAYYKECKDAVEETRGDILEHGGLAAVAPYTLCSGSGTKNSEEYEYIKAVSEAERCNHHITEITLDYQEFIASDPKLLTVMGPIERGEAFIAYGADKKCAFGVFGNRIIEGKALSEALSLPSDEFSIIFGNEKIEITCYGAGSGFGLSLCGAEYMAQNQKGYEKIIEYYYPELKLNKIYYN